MKKTIIKYLKNSVFIKFLISIFLSLFAVDIISTMISNNSSIYNYNYTAILIDVNSFGIVIIMLIIIFSLLILKKLDHLKDK